jgi:hypothetical protein
MSSRRYRRERVVIKLYGGCMKRDNVRIMNNKSNISDAWDDMIDYVNELLDRIDELEGENEELKNSK